MIVPSLRVNITCVYGIVFDMFAFIVTVLLAIPSSPAAEQYTIQSSAVYLSHEDCMTGMNLFGKMFTSGLPPGTRIQVRGSCVAPESVEG